jgi:hypothetical protein
VELRLSDPHPFIPPRKGEGTRAQFCENRVYDGIYGRHDFVVREADNPEALLIQIASPSFIMRYIRFKAVLVSIDFNNQLGSEAAKIRYIRADGHLSSEMPARKWQPMP